MVGLEVEVRDHIKIGDLEEPLLGEDVRIFIPWVFNAIHE